MTQARYAIAIGSNRPGRHGPPYAEVAAAIRALGGVVAIAAVQPSAPLGPSLRRYANTAVLVESTLPPPAMLARLKALEAAAGRRRGRRWGARVLDLDIILWSGGAWVTPGLRVPHPLFRTRRFVLEPLCRIAPDWRDPVTGLSVRQLTARLTRPRPLPRSARA